MSSSSPLTKELDNKGTVIVTYKSRSGKTQKEAVGEPGLVSWKDCWDSLLNDSKFRSFFLGGNLYEYVIPVNFAPSPEDRILRSFDVAATDIAKFTRMHASYVASQKRRLPKFNVTKTKGSILIKGGGEEDHYLSFRIKGNVLKIFDPADTSGRYDSYFPLRYRKLLSIITGKRVVLSVRHPQCTPGDTFCQTWTVARLNSGLKQYTKYTPRKTSPLESRLKSSVPNMYNIVYRIAQFEICRISEQARSSIRVQDYFRK